MIDVIEVVLNAEAHHFGIACLTSKPANLRKPGDARLDLCASCLCVSRILRLARPYFSCSWCLATAPRSADCIFRHQGGMSSVATARATMAEAETTARPLIAPPLLGGTGHSDHCGNACNSECLRHRVDLCHAESAIGQVDEHCRHEYCCSTDQRNELSEEFEGDLRPRRGPQTRARRTRSRGAESHQFTSSFVHLETSRRVAPLVAGQLQFAAHRSDAEQIQNTRAGSRREVEKKVDTRSERSSEGRTRTDFDREAPAQGSTAL